jgi:hypothetical protein
MPDETTDATTDATTDEEVTLEALFARHPALREEYRSRVERAIKKRLGEKPKAATADPDASAELEAARRRIEELEGATKSEAERLIAQRDKALASAKAAEEAAKARVEQAESRLRRTLVENAVASYAAEKKIPGAAHFVRLAAEQFAVDDAGRIYFEDEDTGKRLDVAARLDSWRKLPGNEIWSPPAPGGSGQRGGAAQRGTDPTAWRSDPELERQLAEQEIRGLRPVREAPAAVTRTSSDGAQ